MGGGGGEERRRPGYIYIYIHIYNMAVIYVYIYIWNRFARVLCARKSESDTGETDGCKEGMGGGEVKPV